MELIPHAALGFHTVPTPEQTREGLRQAIGGYRRKSRAARRAERRAERSQPKGRTERTTRPKGRTDGPVRPTIDDPGSTESTDPSAD